MAAFEAIGGVPSEILYDRMKAAVIGETVGSIVYNRALIDFAERIRACLAFVERLLQFHLFGIRNSFALQGLG